MARLEQSLRLGLLLVLPQLEPLQELQVLQESLRQEFPLLVLLVQQGFLLRVLLLARQLVLARRLFQYQLVPLELGFRSESRPVLPLALGLSYRHYYP
jgi:hypothetical protein